MYMGLLEKAQVKKQKIEEKDPKDIKIEIIKNLN